MHIYIYMSTHICIYVTKSHFVHLKLPKHCELTILQYKVVNKKKQVNNKDKQNR